MLITNVDRVLEMLRTTQKLPVKGIAAALHAEPKSIEKLAKLLEEEKKLSITYKMLEPWLVYGFQEKQQKEKKPFFVWKKQQKQQAPQAATAIPPVPPVPPQRSPLLTGKKQKQAAQPTAAPAEPLQVPPAPPHQPLFTWRKQPQIPQPKEAPQAPLPVLPERKPISTQNKQALKQALPVPLPPKHLSFPFFGKKREESSTQEANKQPPAQNRFIRLTPQPEQVSTNKDKEIEQELNEIIAKAMGALQAKSYKDVYTAYNEGSARYKALQGADSKMKFFKRLSAVHDSLLKELKH
ncbi:hypothetical protein HY491_00765 [Candidatus Woesearchaeota archaeon]|nr:hypothetical protein [Candidatus Woesearchaeota archaeon]